MIDPLSHIPAPAPGQSPSGAGPRFHMRQDPDARMAGSIPVWESSRHTSETGAGTVDFDKALNYAGSEPVPDADDAPDAFGFGDLIDIINPLHHIPLVNTLYENLTGDNIIPAGRIVGGALFGGFAGAAAGIANVIVEEETGKDVTGNIVALVTNGNLPRGRPDTMSPEESLDDAARLAFNGIDAEPLPALAFGINPVRTIMPEPDYERFRPDDDRMAGTMVRKKTAVTRTASPLPAAVLANPASINLANITTSTAYEPVTQISLSPLK